MSWSIIGLGELHLETQDLITSSTLMGIWIISFLSCSTRWDRGGLWGIVINAMISWSIIGLEEAYWVLWITSFLSCSTGWDREGYQSRSGGSASGSHLLHCVHGLWSVVVLSFTARWYRVGYQSCCSFKDSVTSTSLYALSLNYNPFR